MDSFLEVAYIFGIIVPILIVILALILVYKGVNVVPQSEVYVIERFGKYTKTLKAGLNLIIPLFTYFIYIFHLYISFMAEFFGA